MNLCITIGRSSGSGGRIIGKRVAEQLGFPYYDKELLERVAKESGMSEEVIAAQDEKPQRSFLNALVMEGGFGIGGHTISELPLNHRIFLAQFETIRSIADEGPCVIVGRCADYVLENRPNALTVFIHGAIEDRIALIEKEHGITTAQARDYVQKTDKGRSSYYNYFTNKKWSSTDSYMLSIDSSAFGIEGSVELIKKAAEAKALRSDQQNG